MIDVSRRVSSFTKLLVTPVGVSEGLYSTSVNSTEPTLTRSYLSRRRIEPYRKLLVLPYKYRGRVYSYKLIRTRHSFLRKSPNFSTENYFKLQADRRQLFSTKLLSFSVIKNLYLKHVTLTPIVKTGTSRARLRLTRKIKRHLRQYLFFNNVFNKDSSKVRATYLNSLVFFDDLATNLSKRVATKRSKRLTSLLSNKIMLLKTLRSFLQNQNPKKLKKGLRKGIALSHRKLTRTVKMIS